MRTKSFRMLIASMVLLSPWGYGQAAAPEWRNNFVADLASANVPEAGETVCTFNNPREGWVFIAVDNVQVAARLDQDVEPIAWRANPESGRGEAMRHLADGEHALHLIGAAGTKVSVRAIPELAFCYYPSSRHIEAYPPYDWEYVSKHVLPHVNVLVSRSDIPPEQFAAWSAEGRRWIRNEGLPGLSSEQAPSVDDVYAVWNQNPALTEPGYSGLIVDEFLDSSPEHYAAWSGALRRLHENPAFAGQTFYAWCTTIFEHPQGLEFCKQLLTGGDRLVWEVYLREDASREQARKRIEREVRNPLREWREKLPGVEERLVLCPGYLSAPPESLNLHPNVDYHVFLDEQFLFFATDPAFRGVYGVMEYMAAYADEESLRFAHKLFRHYCIDGNSTRFSNDPYQLAHVMNPDFDNGLDAWRVQPAHDGSIKQDSMKGFSWLEGRYPRTKEGDTFCVFTRSADAPNALRQTIRSLQPGRLYSVKLISANLDALDQQQVLPLFLRIDGAESVPEHGFQHPFASCYSHEVEPYTRENPAHFNFHRLVFRATGETADLIISDWPDASGPGGATGQRLAFNFVEVQPFWAP